MMTDETRQTIADYLAGCRTQDPRFEDAVQSITLMTFVSPAELQWDVILEGVRQAVGDEDLATIAAGPLEGFLGRHGAAWIDRVQGEVRSNPKFARALTGVWQYTMDDELWERVKLLQQTGDG